MLRTPSLAGARAFERMLTTPLPPHARTPRPQVDSFWQAQAVLMLTPRMPLYIPCVYNAFLYWSNVAAAHAFAGRDADARAAADAAASAAARSPREHTGEFEDLDAVASFVTAAATARRAPHTSIPVARMPGGVGAL